ncbi:MAG: glycosyltransferase family 4 protein [Candidatus Omnitrophica bacterium]|nr:glycosyltransferase family 4 protein [Candidatus Omnitrophota bacterium]MDD5553349.1 glycosyltransferase family 4 protein [Candidatus Omnitrophota bacterium]
MRIIFITREGYNLSGARVRCYNFARILREYGLQTEVFSYADNLGAKYAEKEFEMSGFEKIRYNATAFKALLKRPKDDIFFMQRLNYHTLAPFLASFLKGHKFIFDCDDWNIRENPAYLFGFYPTSKMEYLTRKIAGYADFCIAASAFLEEYLKRFNSNVYYLPTGVDTDLFTPKPDVDGDPRITFSWIGTAYHKEMGENVEFILSSFLSLAGKYDNIALDICGEGKYLEEIRDRARDLKYGDRIKINGWMPPEKVPDYLSKIDIGLIPLIQETKFNKSKSPTKLFEYMAMAKPTVSSDIGELPRIIKDSENGFLAKTKESFVEKMESLVKDRDLRAAMGRRAKETVEKEYSLKVLGKRLYDILNRLQ